VKKVRTLLGVCAGVVMIIVPVSALSAAPAMAIAPVPLCSSETTALSGHYHNLTITGNDYVADGATVTVRGNLTLARGACLDAFSLGTVHIGGSIFVGKGATLALGCSPGALGPPFTQPPCNGMTTDDTVGGDIIANQPLTMYLTADTVGGSVFSFGGGPGTVLSPYVNFPIKENTIRGNLIVQGWHGAWAGALRNTVGGNLIFSRNIAADPDANEVVTNTVKRNLICIGNSPAVQFGDSGGLPNTVGGHKLGQCTAV
jgi:hypothetical protein